MGGEDTYNATVYRENTAGNVLSTFGARVTPASVIVECSARHRPDLEGTREYDAWIRAEFAPFALRVDMDGGAGYRASLPCPR